MALSNTASKILSKHLERRAFIYVRQSTLMQVREHTGSTARQYDLAKRASHLGWPDERIVVIDGPSIGPLSGSGPIGCFNGPSNGPLVGERA